MTDNHPHPAALAADTLLSQCQVRFTRRSGPGGQHRNKVETAVVLRHLPTNLQAEANERRSQAENRRVALKRLRLKLALEIRTRSANNGAASPLWRSRLRGGRIAIDVEHDDFPSLLAEALDAIAAHRFDLPSAAQQLGCTASQLKKLVQLEPLAIQYVNAQRRAAGLRPLA